MKPMNRLCANCAHPFERHARVNNAGKVSIVCITADVRRGVWCGCSQFVEPAVAEEAER